MSEFTSTCYAILATPRSGSSVLAGVVHNLGISMGKELMPPCDHNEKGFYEDMDFIDMHRVMYGTIPYLFDNPEVRSVDQVKPAYTNLIRKRCTQKVWGIKDPRMVFLLQEFMGNLTKTCRVKIISSARPINKSAESMRKVLRLDEKRASEIIGRYEVARLNALKWVNENGIPNITVNYEDLMADPKKVIGQVAEFCEVTDPVKIEAANLTIDKTLWHNK